MSPRHHSSVLLVLLLALCPWLWAQEAGEILTGGALNKAETTLAARVTAGEGGDSARVALGITQMLRAYESLGAVLYKHGLRTVSASRQAGMFIGQFLPENPQPEVATLPILRTAAAAWLKELEKAEATLLAVKDPAVKLVFQPGRLQFDPLGQGQPLSAAMLMGGGQPLPAGHPAERAVAFDYSDVVWLRGYLHFLMGLGELFLTYDQQELFDTLGHLAFQKTDTPHQFLLTGDRNLDRAMRPMDFNPVIFDIIALIHLQNYPVREAERGKRALLHFEAMAKLAVELWTHIQAETDDDREWLPSPRQTSVTGRRVTAEQVAVWLRVMGEIQDLLAGKTLLPFWRGNDASVGVNLRKVLAEPANFDLILWFQGSGAAPFLETGKRTALSQRELLDQIRQTSGSSPSGQTDQRGGLMPERPGSPSHSSYYSYHSQTPEPG